MDSNDSVITVATFDHSIGHPMTFGCDNFHLVDFSEVASLVFSLYGGLKKSLWLEHATFKMHKF